MSLFLLVGLLPVIGISSFLYSEEIETSLNTLEILLLSKSESNSNLISKWLSERQNNVIHIASNQVLISKTNILANSNNVDEIYRANLELQTQSAILLENYSWLTEYVISDPTGNILFSTEHRIPKDDIFTQNHFASASTGKLGMSDLYHSQDILKNENNFYETLLPTMWISYPIRGEVGISSILSARVDIFQIPKISNAQTEYNSFDTYLVNSEGYFISKPNSYNLNHDTQIRPELTLDLRDPISNEFTQIFQLANQNLSQLNLMGYKNHVGETVIGSISPITNSDWYVISEINKSENDSKIFPTQIIFFNFISLSILAVIGASVFLSSKIIEPVRKLKQATEVVSQGNFDIKLKPKGNDEISYLFESFNKMTESLNAANNRVLSTELKYKQLYDNAPDLYRTITPDGIILDCNIAYATALGYTKKEIVGKSIFDHISKDAVDTLNNIFVDWKKTGIIKNKEIWLKRKDGSTFPSIINVSSVYDEEGKLIGSNTAIRDITELYKVRQEIEASQKIIEKQYHDLKEVDKAKDEFLAMITHELRTPLVPIKAYVEILLSQKFGPLNLIQKDKLKIIESSSDSMLKLVKDLLDAQKLELGQLKLEKDVYIISEIIKNVIYKVKPNAEIRGVSITSELQEDISCLCDSSRMEQVLHNLISNSLDFSPKNTGQIHIILTREGEQARILVKDNGIGIVQESLDKIFVKFYQVNTTHTREHGGTGLGLAVCKGIIENHGGKIWAESEGRDKGAKIHILLPIIINH